MTYFSNTEPTAAIPAKPHINDFMKFDLFHAIHSLACHHRRYGYKRFFLLSFLCLTGCSLSAYQPDEATPNLETIACQHQLVLEGRFLIQYFENDHPESVQGKFTWQQTREKDFISVLSPLNQVIAQIEITPDMTLLVSAGKPPKYAHNAEALLMNELGLPLPVSGLRNWLQGCAISQKGSAFKASPQNNTVQTQDGWHITYVSWKKVDEKTLRPLRIDMQYSNDRQIPVNNLAIRIIIDNWQPSS